MITRVFSNLAFFSTVKYDILNGKYLIPQGPKRPLSAFLIFSQEGRKKLSQSKSQSSKTDVAAQAKSFGQAWKALNPEQKKKYEDEAKKLKDKYQLEKNVYSAKYKDPFKRVTANNLIQKQFYEKNKFASLQEGSKAFSDYKKQLKEEDLQKYNKSAEELNSQKQKISSMYTIPELKYKDFNAYLRHLRAKNPEIPAKKDLKETQLQKFQKEYEELSAKYSQDLKQFAKSFNLKPTDLISMINKLKNPEEKLDEEGRKLKDTQKKLKEEAMQDLKKSQESLKLQKAKIKSRAQKIVQKQIKQLQKAVEKQKKIVARADAKFKPKIEKIERQKKQLDTEKTVKKEFEKKEATEQGSKRKSAKKTTQSKEQPKVQSSQPAQQAQPAQSTQSK